MNSIILELNKDLLWLSDWDGEDVGYNDVLIVGLYQLVDTDCYFYIDIENMKILESWKDEEE